MIFDRNGNRHITTTLLFVVATIISAHASGQSVQDFFGTSVTVVNMIPADQGGESNQDSEPNLAVDPENPMHIAGSAFTPNPMEDEQSMLLAHIQSSHQFRALAAGPDDDGEEMIILQKKEACWRRFMFQPTAVQRGN